MSDLRQKKLRIAIRKRDVAELHVANVLKTQYPIGSPIEWEGNNDVYAGVVTAHSDGDRIKVRNTATGAEYWIFAYRITA